MLPICRAHKEMDKVRSLPSECGSAETLESGCEKEVLGGLAIRSVFTIRVKAKVPSDKRGIDKFFFT